MNIFIGSEIQLNRKLVKQIKGLISIPLEYCTIMYSAEDRYTEDLAISSGSELKKFETFYLSNKKVLDNLAEEIDFLILVSKSMENRVFLNLFEKVDNLRKPIRVILVEELWRC